MNPDRVAKPFRQVPPRNAGPKTIENRFHEQPVVLGRSSEWPSRPGKISLILSH
jgi:hypothetical protein